MILHTDDHQRWLDVAPSEERAIPFSSQLIDCNIYSLRGGMDRKAWGGVALLSVGLFLGREFIVWLFNKLLDAGNSAIQSGVSFASFSWQNTAAIVLTVVGLGFVLWPHPKATKAAAGPNYAGLARSSAYVLARIRSHRSARYFNRDRLEPITDLSSAGVAVLLSFEKAGFSVPDFPATFYAEQVCRGIEHYLATLIPLLTQGHFEQAKECSLAISNVSVNIARDSAEQNWFTQTY